VRIALNLKNVEYETRQVDLREDEQRSGSYRELNPQGLVPMLEIDGHRLTQSLAIINYLDIRYANHPLIPAAAADRAHVVAMAMTIACDIHPLNNLGSLQYLRRQLKHEQPEIDAWYHYWIHSGFEALETLLRPGPYSYGATVTLADICLVPQVYNARRLKVPLDNYPKIVAVDAACAKLPAFQRAHPDQQPDAE